MHFCYKTINGLNRLDSSTLIFDPQELHVTTASNKFQSTTFEYSFKHLVVYLIDAWNNLPKEIAKVKNLNSLKNRLRRYLSVYM